MKRRSFIKKIAAIGGALRALPFLSWGRKKEQPLTYEELMNYNEKWRCNENLGWHQACTKRAYKSIVEADEFPIRYYNK